jgi:general secretion pathway protein I
VAIGKLRPLHRSTSSGFTLIEVLLAFVVFALSFAVVLEIISGSMRNTMRARQYTEVALITQSVMDQVGLNIPLEAGVRANGDSGAYRWELQISSFAGTDDTARSVELEGLTGIELLEVEFVISWGDGPSEHSDRFSTVKAVLTKQEEKGA